MSVAWIPISELPEFMKDGRDIVLHVDWEPLTVVGYWGVGQAEFGEDDGGITWRVRWDETPIRRGFDEPTHWMAAPDPPS